MVSLNGRYYKLTCNATYARAYSNIHVGYNYTYVSAHAHFTCTSYVLYAYLYCRYVLVKNDALASERSTFSENHNYKRFLCIEMNPLVPIYLCIVAKKLRTNTHTHTGQLPLPSLCMRVEGYI